MRSLLLPATAAIVVAVVAVALAHPGTGVSRPRPSAALVAKAGPVTIAIRNYGYTPDTLTVKAGTRVTWTNHDATAHTATADQGGFDTGTINPGKSKTIDLRLAGNYPYHCLFHAFMTGEVKVVG